MISGHFRTIDNVCNIVKLSTADLHLCLVPSLLDQFFTPSTPDRLRQVRLPVQSIAVCKSILDAVNLSITDAEGLLCAGYTNVAEDTCYGDSGGPLVCIGLHDESLANGRAHTIMAAGNNGANVKKRWILYGITSFGIRCANYAEYPAAVYTDVLTYMPWIRRNMLVD